MRWQTCPARANNTGGANGLNYGFTHAFSLL